MSSFKRRIPTQTSTLPPATRISAHNGQVLVSTGVPSLDDVLGGGIPVGSLLLLKEDRYTGYAHLLLKYFVTQGIVSGHAVCLASADENPEETVRGLMGVVEGTAAAGAEEEAEEDGEDLGAQLGGAASRRMLGALRRPGLEEDRMKIAWRYEGLPRFSSTLSRGAAPGVVPGLKKGGDTAPQIPYCNVFDLTKRISPSILDSASNRLALLDLSTCTAEGEEGVYAQLLEQVKGLIDEGGFKLSSPVSSTGTRGFLRIAIHSIGSPFWGQGASKAASHALCKFFHGLRALLRDSFAVCVLTMPAHMYGDFHGLHSNPIVRRIEHMCDAVIEIESFAGSPKPVNPLYTSDYHGLFHPRRLPRIGSLVQSSRVPEIELGSLGFKVRRKRFSVETFHLPPEVEDTTARSQDGGDGAKKAKRAGGGTAAGGSAGGSGAGARVSRQIGSVAASKGLGCGSGGGKNPLDF
ncbi:Elongator subunit elp4 [Borealophlyctis nickersoniae]|nr:Elongator subunit elp4 [Borealophlyctis nickersoniae]